MAGSFVPQLIEEPGDEIGGASGTKLRFHVQFQAKRDSNEFPFTIANEIVAAAIGQALGLNVPGVHSYLIGGTPYVLSHLIDRRSDMAKPTPPPVTSAGLARWVTEHPREVHGAILFDLFLANNDRAFGPDRRNLFLNSDDRLVLYDNANCCFYRNRPSAGIVAGIARLDAVEADPQAMFDMAHKGNTYFELLDTWEFIDFWFSRIQALPDFLFEDAVQRIPGYLARPTTTERQRLSQFLIARKRHLVDHIIRCQSSRFPRLPRRGDHA